MEEIRYQLNGEWEVGLGNRDEADFSSRIYLPGTIQEQGDKIKGLKPNTEVSQDKLTPLYNYVGVASFRTHYNVERMPEGCILLTLERTRSAKVYVNGHFVEPFFSGNTNIVTPYVCDLSFFSRVGDNELVIEVDNTFNDGIPKDAILNSHLATDHTQTNWNGIIGDIRLEMLPPVSARRVFVYGEPDIDNIRVECLLFQRNVMTRKAKFIFTLTETGASVEKEIVLSGLENRVNFNFRIKEFFPDGNMELWDEFNSKLYHMTLVIVYEGHISKRSEIFGVRKLGISEDKRHILVNGRKVFFRSETNCASFPLTGYSPTDRDYWRKLLANYKKFGINHVRFHSWCPPGAALRAADELGIYVQVELSQWDFNAFEKDEDFFYFKDQASAILDTFSNHPSLIAITWGNELRTKRRDRLSKLCRIMRERDNSRLYAEGSNVFYGERGINLDSDFVMAQGNLDEEWRGAFADYSKGFLENKEPDTRTNYSQALPDAPIPIISFEVGQFQTYPDYREIEKYTGLLKPLNLQKFADLRSDYQKSRQDDYHRVTCNLSNLCYREEAEAVLRTQNMNGISILGLQDFPGQGTALIGMLDALGDPKPAADAAKFKQSFNSVVPLVTLDKRIFSSNEDVRGKVLVSNYSKDDLKRYVFFTITCEGKEVFSQKLYTNAPQGTLTYTGQVAFNTSIANAVDSLKKLEVRMELEDTEFVNTYDLWVVPASQSDAEGPHVVHQLDETVHERLKAGEHILFLPYVNKDTVPVSVQSSFIPSFWCWNMFRKYSTSGTMGLLNDTKHPVFDKFPVDEGTTHLFWHLLKNGRSLIKKCDGITNISEMIDNIQRNNEMTMLYEVGCEKGSLLVSTFAYSEAIEAKFFRLKLSEYVKNLNEGKLATNPPCQAWEDIKRDFPVHKAMEEERVTKTVFKGSEPAHEMYELKFKEPAVVDMVVCDFFEKTDEDDKKAIPDVQEVLVNTEDGLKPVSLIYSNIPVSGNDNRIYFEPVKTSSLVLVLRDDVASRVKILTVDEKDPIPYGINNVTVFETL